MPFESGIGVQKWDCLKIKKSIHYGSMEIYLQCISTHRQVYLVGIGAIFKNKVHFLRQNFNLDKQALTNFTTNVVKRTLRKPLLFFRFLNVCSCAVRQLF